jgi:tRNA threonylcarbamoyladenosine biosynthesis protein TsaB
MGNVWTLTLDTATPYLSLGLFRGEEGLGRVVRVERRHEEVLFGLLDETLEALGARREEIGALVLGEGPGSYTGLRIALAAGEGVALALGARVYGVSSLLAAAWPYLEEGKPLTPSSPPETGSTTGPLTLRKAGSPEPSPPPPGCGRRSFPNPPTSWTPRRTPGPSTSFCPSPGRGWSPFTSNPPHAGPSRHGGPGKRFFGEATRHGGPGV